MSFPGIMKSEVYSVLCAEGKPESVATVSKVFPSLLICNSTTEGRPSEVHVLSVRFW